MSSHNSSCLLCSLLKIFIAIVVVAGVVAVALWLVFRPDDIKAYVHDASLTEFTLSSSTNTLDYNLTLEMTIRNPNGRTGIYFDYVEAQALFAGSAFSLTTVPPYYQQKETTKSIHPVFQGSQIEVEDRVVGIYERELGEGYFYVDVKLYTKIRLKAWVIKIHHLKPKIHCVLKLPVPAGSLNSTFEMTKCDVDF